MYSSKFTFIANSHSFDIEVSGKDEEETLKNKYCLLSPFISSVDPSTGSIAVNYYQQNTAELRIKIKELVELIAPLDAKIHRLNDYFEKKLKDGEWFFFVTDQELTTQQVDFVLNELLSIGATDEEKHRNQETHNLLQKIRSVYDVKAYGEQTKGFIGEPDKAKRICRYCRKSMPEVTFKKVAHTISEAFGNTRIKTNEECDTCNQLFGDTIEQDFLSIFDLPRLFFKIHGKSGIPHRFEGDNYIIERESDGNLKVSYKLKDGEELQETQDYLKKIMLTPHRCFPEQNIYKCLCKYAMGVLDADTLKHFERTRKWLIGECTESTFPQVARFCHPDVVEHPHLMVYVRRSDASKEMPHVVVELRIINMAFVYIVPFSDQDEIDFSLKENFDRYWGFFEMYSKIDGWQMSDCSSMVSRQPTVALSFTQREQNK